MSGHADDEMLARVAEGTYVIFQLHAASFSPQMGFEQPAYEVGYVCLL
jgi:hypothetical protein